MKSPVSAPPLKNPLYEVGISHPINQKHKKPNAKINLPIPKNVVFFREFKAGETLPVYFKASGNLVSLNSEPQLITFVRNIFVRATRDQISYSLDQKNWLPFTKIFAGSVAGKIYQNDNDASPEARIELVANSIRGK